LPASARQNWVTSAIVRPVGDGVFALRIHVGPGHRVYYWRHGAVTYWLLCGGDKSTQRRDIGNAKALRIRVENEA